LSGQARDPADVLLIEDDPGDALMTREAFVQAGKGSRFHVLPNGHLALRFLRQAGEFAAAPVPGLILLGLGLPGLPGLDVLAQVRADPGLTGMPVVVLTASRLPRDVRRCRELGADDYIVKPLDFDGFATMIQRVDACLRRLTPAVGRAAGSGSG
jgi:DNA-binding response OmpR family regulator